MLATVLKIIVFPVLQGTAAYYAGIAVEGVENPLRNFAPCRSMEALAHRYDIACRHMAIQSGTFAATQKEHVTVFGSLQGAVGNFDNTAADIVAVHSPFIQRLESYVAAILGNRAAIEAVEQHAVATDAQCRGVEVIDIHSGIVGSYHARTRTGAEHAGTPVFGNGQQRAAPHLAGHLAFADIRSDAYSFFVAEEVVVPCHFHLMSGT